MRFTPLIRNLAWATPFYLGAPVPFILLAQFLEIEIELNAVLFGALGWWIALIVRVPSILVIKKKNLDLQLASKLTIGLSGPAEEITRFVLLTIIGLSVSKAYSVGLGWGMIEILYGLIQIIGLGVLDQKSDEKAEEAKTMMKQMGMDKTLGPSTPFWGALERVSAGALHIGFSLLLIMSPYVLIITIPLHSLINFFVVKMNKVSIAKSQLGLLLIGGAILLLSLVLV